MISYLTDMDGVLHREGEIIRKTLIPMAYYVVQAGLIGTALIKGGVNAWWLAAVVWAGAVLVAMAFNRGRAARPAAALGVR